MSHPNLYYAYVRRNSARTRRSLTQNSGIAVTRSHARSRGPESSSTLGPLYSSSYLVYDYSMAFVLLALSSAVFELGQVSPTILTSSQALLSSILLCIEVQQFRPYAKPTSVRSRNALHFPARSEIPVELSRLSLLLLHRTTAIMSSLCVALQGVLHSLRKSFGRAPRLAMHASALTLPGPLPQSSPSPGGSLTRGQRRVDERRGQPVEGRGPKWVVDAQNLTVPYHGPR